MKWHWLTFIFYMWIFFKFPIISTHLLKYIKTHLSMYMCICNTWISIYITHKNLHLYLYLEVFLILSSWACCIMSHNYNVSSQEQLSVETAYYYLTIFSSFLILSMATPVGYGSSQFRGQFRAVAASLCHSQSNPRSELHLQPATQLMAMVHP